MATIFLYHAPLLVHLAAAAKRGKFECAESSHQDSEGHVLAHHPDAGDHVQVSAANQAVGGSIAESWAFDVSVVCVSGVAKEVFCLPLLLLLFQIDNDRWRIGTSADSGKEEDSGRAPGRSREEDGETEEPPADRVVESNEARLEAARELDML